MCDDAVTQVEDEDAASEDHDMRRTDVIASENHGMRQAESLEQDERNTNATRAREARSADMARHTIQSSQPALACSWGAVTSS